ncbi:tetratricopeptide repeat protein [Profundibacter sp.]
MPIFPRRSIAALVLGLATALPASFATADGLSGAYLAARHASYSSDYKAGAEYYTKALIRDPSNVTLLENALVSFVGLGDLDRAVPVARKMAADGVVSQISRIVLLVDLAKKQDFDGMIAMVEKGDTIGPLVDGLALAWAEVGRGNMDAALAHFDEVAKGKGTRGFGLYHKALALASVGDFEGAEVIYAGDENGPLRVTLGGVLAHAQVLSQLDRNADALELLTAVFGNEVDPRIAQLRNTLEAQDKLPFTTVQNPPQGLAEVFYTVANALQGETEDGYTLVYTRMAEYLNPGHIDAILMGAGLLEQLEQYDLATEAYNRVGRDDPSFHAAELGRAAALRDAGKQEAAIEVLEQLAKSHGDLPQVHSSLGNALRRMERYTEAADAYSRALEIVGVPVADDWFVFYARGICYERTDRWEDANADFRMALKLNPNQPQVLNYLGYSLLEKNIKLDEALGMIERAVLAVPNDGYITDSLGWALYRLRRFEEAVGYMERAAELTPVDPIVSDHLGDTLWAVGRKREAEFQWRRAMSFEPEEADAIRIRRKLEIGLDAVLKEEGAEPLPVLAHDG